MSWRKMLVALLIFLPAVACAQAPLAEPGLAVSPLAPELESLLSLEAREAADPTADSILALSTDADEAAAVRRFYASRRFEPLWVGDDVKEARAAELLDLLAAAGDEGLLPVQYGMPGLTEQAALKAPAEKAVFELSLTHAFIRYGQAVHAGQVNPTLVDSEVRVVPPEVTAGTLLFAAGNNAFPADVLRALAPSGQEYRRLRTALAGHRAKAASGGWPQIPDGPTLKPAAELASGEGNDDDGPRVAALRARLAAGGELPAWRDDGSPLFDAGLALAVKAFQARHGLEQDGIVGPRTLAALNVTIEQRIDQIVLNLERRRWMGPLEGDRYIFVNLADFQLKLVERGKTVHTARVVVGTPFHRTPVFTENMTYLVINPEWNVPSSIARNELLPKAQEDPGYLAANNFAVLDAAGTPVDLRLIDWSAQSRSSLPYRFRQGSGDGNALGRIKFMLPNPYNIYLHDTPSKRLFGETVRAFSHGCIRVEDPYRLAEIILAGQGWNRADLDAAHDAGDRRVVSLEKEIPVYISYITAWTNKDGTMHFRDDIYERDARLSAAILGIES